MSRSDSMGAAAPAQWLRRWQRLAIFEALMLIAAVGLWALA